MLQHERRLGNCYGVCILLELIPETLCFAGIQAFLHQTISISDNHTAARNVLAEQNILAEKIKERGLNRSRCLWLEVTLRVKSS